MDPEGLIALIGGGTLLITLGTILISILCTVVPIGAIVWFILARRKKAQAMQSASMSWLPTPGKIIKSRVEVSSGGNGASVNAVVIYEYSINGIRYEGNQVRAGSSLFNVTRSSDAYDTVDRYPVGKEVTVFYDPANPALSALER